ncbi:MAG: cupin domain-containing protein [Trueperaceae bacterium]|nr:cupin domain-containing protein [Trueperaceae bacterium]
MEIVSISDGRQFSLKSIQRSDLVKTDDLHIELICFEAGQRDEEGKHSHSSVYQVLEGEALVKHEGNSKRLGKGKLLSVPAQTAHTLENAGGGLLVVMATRALG